MKLMLQLALMATVTLSVDSTYAAKKNKAPKKSELKSKQGYVANFKEVMSLYSQGKYHSTVEELDRIENKMKGSDDKKTIGLIEYWKGMSFNRLQRFADAIKSFERSLNLGYDTLDINYEYGQALFAADKLVLSRIHFNESFKKGFKRGPCLYYMAFVAKELGEPENAKSLYGAVKKLDDNDGKDTRQPAEMQLADMELEEAEKRPDVFRAVEREVIPIYQNAYDMNPESPLAPRIKEKIVGLQRKYELILFQLRNGRPTAIPPYYLRLAQELGNDTNVTYTPTETTVSKAKQSSIFSKTEAMGRYSFYHKNFFVIAPEMRFNYTRYYNRVKEIYRNDNYMMAPSLRTSYEHTLWEKPASALVDYEFSYVHRDVYQQQSLDFASSSHALMLGERFNFFAIGESTVRVKNRQFKSYLDSSNSNTLSLIYEQIIGLKNSTLIFYSSVDRTRVNAEAFSTNAMTLRGDWLLPKYKDWFTPSVGMMVTLTDPINDRDDRGLEKLLMPSLRLNRRFGKNWGTNFRLEHSKNISKDETSFAYQKTLYALELEYLF